MRLLALAPLIALGLFFGAPAPVADADVVSGTQMMTLHNQLRFAIGAPTIPMDARVTLAAQNHANYNSANRITGHYETAGLPYYTGYAPRDRVIAAGLTTTFVSEVATGGSGGLAGVSQLWDAPYHRLGLMHPSASSAGWGHSDLAGSATVGDITYDFGIRSVDYVRSPANGQTGIPTSWSGNESRARYRLASAARSAIRSCSCTPVASASICVRPRSSRRAARACRSTTRLCNSRMTTR
jgi:hypothetical protein